MYFQLNSLVILLTVITFQSSQAASLVESQNTTESTNRFTNSVYQQNENCKDELSERVVKQQPRFGGDYPCEEKKIGRKERSGQFPSSCAKGPGWRGILTKTPNLERTIDWWNLVHQPECVGRIILRASGTEKTVDPPKPNCPIRLQNLCDTDMLIVIYSKTNEDQCFEVEIECDLHLNQDGQSQVHPHTPPGQGDDDVGSGGSEFGSDPTDHTKPHQSDQTDQTGVDNGNSDGHTVEILASISGLAISVIIIIGMKASPSQVPSYFLICNIPTQDLANLNVKHCQRHNGPRN